MQLSSFLRTVLKLDAASCFVMSVAFLGASGPLAQLFGMPEILLTEAGILLAIVGLFILWVGTREQAAPGLVRLVVFGNLGWSLASLASLAVLPAITGLGLAVLGLQAAAVLVFAGLEWRGLQESAWATS